MTLDVNVRPLPVTDAVAVAMVLFESLDNDGRCELMGELREHYCLNCGSDVLPCWCALD